MTVAVIRVAGASDAQYIAELTAQLGYDVTASSAFVVIGGLVVDRSHRRGGIGRALMEHGEEWARKKECSVVRLWSSTIRSDSHRFYERIGYRNIKTQYSFLKSLDDTRGDDVRRFVPRA